MAKPVSPSSNPFISKNVEEVADKIAAFEVTKAPKFPLILLFILKASYPGKINLPTDIEYSNWVSCDLMLK